MEELPIGSRVVSEGAQLAGQSHQIASRVHFDRPVIELVYAVVDRKILHRDAPVELLAAVGVVLTDLDATERTDLRIGEDI